MLRQFLMFALVGTAGFLVDAGTLQFAHRVLGLDLYSGRLLSFLTSATLTWQLNRKLTFRGSTSADGAFTQWAKFLGANAVGAVVNLSVYAALITHVALMREHPTLAVGCGSIAGLFFNFATARFVVFHAHLATTDRT